MGPVNLRDCIKEWQAYKATAEGTPVPDIQEPAPEAVYAGLGRAVAGEMMEDPVFFRLVMGKLGVRILGVNPK